MGTNYYWTPQVNACPECGHTPDEELHVGKSSMGWCFSLHIHPDHDISNLNDWMTRFSEGKIRNEYDDTITTIEMMGVILCRFRSPEMAKMPPQWYADNHATEGPLGLARHADGVAGDGTYDLITGDFS